jgi:hypothetical protein
LIIAWPGGIGLLVILGTGGIMTVLLYGCKQPGNNTEVVRERESEGIQKWAI